MGKAKTKTKPSIGDKVSKKGIDKIAKRFKRQMQKIVDDGKNITKITMQIEDKPPVVIAEKKEEKNLE